jgi:hypothetical protein
MANRDLNRLKSCACREKRTNRWLAALKSIFGKQILKKNNWSNQIKPYFCSTRIRHASHRTAYQGGTFVYMQSAERGKTTQTTCTTYNNAFLCLFNDVVMFNAIEHCKDNEQGLDKRTLVRYFNNV